ncbi:hypothetical protein [Cognatiluteimonas profundi]|uniref:hypothetical protein n=1 Tax=Cognatiluteimonas profundi TaxID=2594501 RepID=UPI00131D4C6F|nr:hypothetical protein [Lysobacter profundi]
MAKPAGNSSVRPAIPGLGKLGGEAREVASACANWWKRAGKPTTALAAATVAVDCQRRGARRSYCRILVAGSAGGAFFVAAGHRRR